MPAFGPGNTGSWGQGSLSQEDQEKIRIKRENAVQHLVTCTVAHLTELKTKLIQLENQRKLKCPRLVPNRMWWSIVSESSDTALLEKVIEAIKKENSPTTKTIVDALSKSGIATYDVVSASHLLQEIEERVRDIALIQEMQCKK
ncbi:MAG TPA: hypothetical protein VJK30_03550 [Coxiellaceae bacterium]|nr:MAG: hypothetical protein A3E81_03220 [Gammaproteobacteria bacterium RIFCSPHIGHO2_12_FULL_36_30]HLB56387.1 hypothetical protein [Coxiellaceae bacterium]